MTPSSGDRGEVIVWSWLPDATEPVPAGLLEVAEGPLGGSILTFAYATSYLAEAVAPPLYLPELPKHRGRQEPSAGLDVHGVIRDGGPDSWGHSTGELHAGSPRSTRPRTPGARSPRAERPVRRSRGHPRDLSCRVKMSLPRWRCDADPAAGARGA